MSKTNGKATPKTNAPISPRTARRLRQKLHMAEEINAGLAATLDAEHRELLHLRRNAADLAKATQSGRSLASSLTEFDNDCTAMEAAAPRPLTKWEQLANLLAAIHTKTIANRCRAYELHTNLLGESASAPMQDAKDTPGAIAEYQRTIAHIDDTLDETATLLDSLLN